MTTVSSRQSAAGRSRGAVRDSLPTVHCPPPTMRGFTLLELVVIVAVLAILAAVVAPSMIQQIGGSRIQATQQEARALYEAMVGTPAEGSSFGFVGDIGRFPGSLTELVQRGSLPNYNTGNYRSVGMGWRGPYVNSGTSNNDYLTDAFGRAYQLNNGQVRSAGTDGTFNNADDIVYPPSVPTITGSISVTVKTTQGNKIIVDPANYRVELLFADDGDEAEVSDDSAPFTFSSVPMGIHAVRVVRTSNPQPGTIVSEDTLIVRPNATTVVELWF
jgi:general secretion pathway protein G